MTPPVSTDRTRVLNLVLTTFEGQRSSQDNQALALKALESKVDGYFKSLFDNMKKQEKKSDAQEQKSDAQEARLSFHNSLIEEQGKDMRMGFEDLTKRIKELDTSIISKLGTMIRGTHK